MPVSDLYMADPYHRAPKSPKKPQKTGDSEESSGLVEVKYKTKKFSLLKYKFSSQIIIIFSMFLICFLNNLQLTQVDVS